jgi:squalene synthase HpnC
MPDRRFAQDLELYGPQSPRPKRISPRRARRYCRSLARRHYENFTVASLLIPASVRPHFYAIYAYCRWADDLADEAGDPQRSLALLEWWEAQLRDCYRGQASHPVFVALAETIQQYSIPADPFIDLLVAFRQDQRQTRYETFDQLLEYCRYSANPVGRLVLYLARSHDPRRVIPSDCVCTGLQLANFLQDVALDWDRGRIYLPRPHLLHYGYDESMFAQRQSNEAFRRMMAAEVAEAEGFLRRGLPLVKMVPADFELDVSLFIHGGLAILKKIRQVDYDVWTRRPVLSKFEKLRILASSWWQLRRPAVEPDEGQEPEAP